MFIGDRFLMFTFEWPLICTDFLYCVVQPYATEYNYVDGVHAVRANVGRDQIPTDCIINACCEHILLHGSSPVHVAEDRKFHWVKTFILEDSEKKENFGT